MAGPSIRNFVFEPVSPELLASWHYMMKQSMAKANEATRDWEQRSKVVNDYCDSRNFTKKRRAAYRMDDLELREYFATAKYYAEEVHRFGAMIQAELNMRMLHGFFPTPMSDL